MSTTRRKFSKEFKAKVVLESLKERETLESLAKKYELLPTQISAWKARALQNFGQVFSSDKQQAKEKPVDIEKLYWQIGQLKVENDFLKKVAMRSVDERKKMVDTNHEPLSVSRQQFLLRPQRRKRRKLGNSSFTRRAVFQNTLLWSFTAHGAARRLGL